MKKQNRRSRIIVIIIALLVLIVGGATGWLPLHRVAGKVLSPVGSFLNKGGVRLNRAFHEIGQLGSLGQQNDELKGENLGLNSRLSQLSELEAENSQLRAQLGYAARSKTQTIPAEVISFQPDSIRQFIHINKGETSGVRKNATVISGDALVGKVSEVGGSSSAIMLVNDPEFRVLVMNQTGAVAGIIKGQPGGAIIMERIQKNQSLSIGDTIVTSGLDGEFPRGLVVGRVESINESNDGIFMVAGIAPAADLRRVSLVQVVKQ